MGKSAFGCHCGFHGRFSYQGTASAVCTRTPRQLFCIRTPRQPVSYQGTASAVPMWCKREGFSPRPSKPEPQEHRTARVPWKSGPSGPRHGQMRRGFSPCGLLLLRLDHHRRPVGQHLGHSLHDLRRIVTRADHRIRAQFPGVLQHQVKRFLPRLLAQIRQ